MVNGKVENLFLLTFLQSLFLVTPGKSFQCLLRQNNFKTNSAPSGLITMSDMILTTEQYNDMYGHGVGADGVRAAVAMSPGMKDRMYRWPNNKLFYDLKNVDYSVKTKVRKTLYKLEKKLGGCINFQERSSGDRVRIRNGGGCSASLGYHAGWGGRMTLGAYCHRVRTIEHEFLHSLGIDHTQSRSDRDNFISIIWNNIDGYRRINFEKLTSGWSTYNLPYDYHSVMHYGGYDFSNNGQPTIKTKVNIRKLN